jgi:hypothetical protein
MSGAANATKTRAPSAGSAVSIVHRLRLGRDEAAARRAAENPRCEPITAIIPYFQTVMRSRSLPQTLARAVL